MLATDYLPSIMQSFTPLLDRVTADPRILAGKPVVRGLRISVEQLLKALAAGQTEADLLAEYPEWELADFAADAQGQKSLPMLPVVGR